MIAKSDAPTVLEDSPLAEAAHWNSWRPCPSQPMNTGP
jgi:hypothetical protein